MVSPSEISRHKGERYSLLGTQCIHCGQVTLEERIVCVICQSQHLEVMSFNHEVKQDEESVMSFQPHAMLELAAK